MYRFLEGSKEEAKDYLQGLLLLTAIIAVAFNIPEYLILPVCGSFVVLGV